MSTVIRIGFVKNEILGNNFIDSLIIIIVQCSKLRERCHPIPFVSGKKSMLLSRSERIKSTKLLKDRKFHSKLQGQ